MYLLFDLPIVIIFEGTKPHRLFRSTIKRELNVNANEEITQAVRFTHSAGQGGQ